MRIDRTYQLNTGGNTDFLNMLSRERLASKKISKTEAVTSQLPYDAGAGNVHIGPSDYVPWQKDNKVCFLRIEGHGFGGVPIELEARLSVQDSPNSAGIVIDVVRYVKLARDRGLVGSAAADLGVHHEASAGADARHRGRAAHRSVPRRAGVAADTIRCREAFRETERARELTLAGPSCVRSLGLEVDGLQRLALVADGAAPRPTAIIARTALSSAP